MLPLRDTVSARRLPMALWALVFANALVFLHEMGLSPPELRAFVTQYGIIPANFTTWDGIAAHWPTAFTAMFVHGGWAHILGNMWFLWIFGDNVEDRLGPVGFLLLYFAGGLAATTLQVWAMPTAAVPTVGASGAIAAILGAYIVLYPSAGVITLVPLPPFIWQIPALIWIGIWFLEQWFNGAIALQMAAQGGVAWWAHIGGFIFGVAVALATGRPKRKSYAYGYDREWPWH